MDTKTDRQIVKASGVPRAIIHYALADTAETTQVNYRGRLADFFLWLDGRPISYVAIKAYRAYLVESGAGASVINQALAAVKRLARELHNAGHLPHATAAAIGDVRGIAQKGQRVHTWLSRDEAIRLLAAPDDQTVKGLRDKAILSLLLGCALRRSEVVAITWGHIQRHGDTIAITNIEGKGDKVRTIPIPLSTRNVLHRWGNRSDKAEGRCVLRQVDRWGNVRTSGISDDTVYNVVGEYGAAIGFPDLNPHDLRRTWAQQAYHIAPNRLEQISLILGHASLKTTEEYLGLKNVDLGDPLLVEVGEGI